MRWHLAAAAALLAMASCNPPLPDNSPPADGDPVVAAEIVGHWFKLVAQGDPRIDVRPLVIEAAVSALADELLGTIPVLNDDTPLYIHVSEALDAGAVADPSTGEYVGFELPPSQQVVPVEQPDGSLLFEGSNLASFFQQATPGGGWSGEAPGGAEGGLDLGGLPVTDVTIKLWLYRRSGYEDLQFRISAEASMEVPLVGLVQVQVTVDGTAYLSEGPQADEPVPGDLDGGDESADDDEYWEDGDSWDDEPWHDHQWWDNDEF